MDYSYPDKDAVKLDCMTNKMLCDIRNALAKVEDQLVILNKKVDSLSETQTTME